MQFRDLESVLKRLDFILKMLKLFIVKSLFFYRKRVQQASKPPSTPPTT